MKAGWLFACSLLQPDANPASFSTHGRLYTGRKRLGVADVSIKLTRRFHALAASAAAETRSTKLMSQLVEERGRLVDAVIEQANSSTPQLAAELAKSLEVVDVNCSASASCCGDITTNKHAHARLSALSRKAAWQDGHNLLLCVLQSQQHYNYNRP
jgi:hypothetical protein